MKFWFQKTTVGLVLIALLAVAIFPSAVLLFPQKAEAQGGACVGTLLTGVVNLIIGTVATFLTIPVGDLVNKSTQTITSTFTGGSFISDCIIKPMVKALVKRLIHSFLTSIVDWINSGFDSSGPRFVSDPASFFADIVDRGAGEMIYGSDLKFLCSPFALDIKLALGLNYLATNRFRDRVSCTLSDIAGNLKNATSQEKQAYRNSWQSWLDLTTQPQNNPYGAYALAKSELEIRIANQQFVAKTEADWSGGFLSTKRCARETMLSEEDSEEYADVFGEGANLEKWTGDYRRDSLMGNIVHCDRWETVTPGVTIKEGLSKTLGSQIDEYVAAEDIDAIFAALTNQLIGAVFSTTGLFSSSRSTNYYRDRWQNDVASGAFNIGSGAEPPVNFEGFNCSTIGNYVANDDNKNVDYMDTAAIPPVKNVKDVVGGNISAPWPIKVPPPAGTPPPALTQYQVFSKLTKYCSQEGFWGNAGRSANDLVGGIRGSADQLTEEQRAAQEAAAAQQQTAKVELSSYNSNTLATQNCSDSAGNNEGLADYAIDGSTYTYSNNTCDNQASYWFKLELGQPEYLDEIVLYAARDTEKSLTGSVPPSIQLQNASGNTLYTVTPNISQETQSLKVLVPTNRTIQVKIIYIPSQARIRELKLYRHLKPVLDTSKVPTSINSNVANGINLITAWTVTAKYYPLWSDPPTPTADRISVVVKDSSENTVTPTSGTTYALPAGTYKITYTATEPAPYILTSQVTKTLKVVAP